MKYNKLLLCVFLILIFGGGLSQLSAQTPKAVILYEGDSRATGKAEAIQIANLLGHFQIPFYLMPTEIYDAGELDNYQFAFLVGYEKHYQLPQTLLSDILNYRGRFFWLGNHIDQLLAIGGGQKTGLKFLGLIEGVKEVQYKSFALSKGNLVLNQVEAQAGCQVMAWALKDNEKIPYVTKNGDFWYVGDLPFSYVTPSDRYLAFSDLLHDFLGIDHPVNHQALLRIEDVNPTSDPDKIKDIADILAKRNIPFLISLDSIYINPEVDEEIPLSSRPRLVDALKYAVSKGGTIVMHGATHQYHGISTADFEFWNAQESKPIREDSPAYVEAKLKIALQECFNCGLYPLVWETPHYAASTVDYETIARHFSTACEQRIFFNNFDWGQVFPFIIEKDIYGQKILPENLGYIPLIAPNEKENIAQEKLEVEQIIKDAGLMNCMRDGVAGFFFHPFLELSLLEELVDGVKAKGCKFINPRLMNNLVTFEDMAVVSGRATIDLPVKDKYLREYYIDEQGRVRREELSLKKFTGNLKRKINGKPGWIYVVQGLENKPEGFIKLNFGRLKKRFAPSLNQNHRTVKAAILWRDFKNPEQEKDRRAFVATFEALGITVNKISSLKNLKDENLLIVPFASARELTSQEIRAIVRYSKSGKVVLLDGFSDLSKAFGFRKAANLRIDGIKDNYNLIDLYFNDMAESIALSPEDKVVYQSRDGFLLGLLRKEKEGGCFFISPLFDPLSGEGYSRFPTLPNILLDYYNFLPPQAVPRWEAYFDPGYRQNISLEILGQRWRKAGIRAIHVAGWHFYPSYTFDYKRLVSVCHHQGIAVYLWLELPYLTQDFWEKHPEFREKNYLGQDVRTFWRYPLALEDPKCLKAVKAQITKTLKNYDFDGVNLAEVYFEGDNLKKADKFAPFHPTARRMFGQKYGYDPVALFDPNSSYYCRANPKAWQDFMQFRQDLIYQLHNDLTGFLVKYKKERGDFDVLLTVLDSIKNPEVKELWGVDSRRIAGLVKKFPITLVVEDPEKAWNNPPERYWQLKQAYYDLGLTPQQLAVDINVVDCHYNEKGAFAAKIPTGTELFELVRNASKGGNRLLLYAEYSIPEYDLPYLSNALEQIAGVILPSPKDDALEPLQANWASCNILAMDEKTGGLDLTYDSPSPAYLAVSKEPRGLWIDDEKKKLTAVIGNQEWIVFLPGGKHQARVKGENKIIFEMEAASYMESRLLLAFGIFSCGLLFLLYLLRKGKSRA